jgi:hypothetical protein
MTESLRRTLAVGYSAALVVIIGSLGPWATFGPFSASGTQGDGIVSMVFAIITAFMVWRWSGKPAMWKLAIGMLAAALALATTGYDVVNISGSGVALGWGLILALLGSVGLVVSAARLVRRRPSLVA